MSAPVRLDLTLVSGDDETVVFEFREADGSPFVITGRTYKMEVRTDPADVSAACTFTCTVAGAAGEVTATASETQTDNLTAGDPYVWSLLEDASGTLSTLLTGRVAVIAQVAKP